MKRSQLSKAFELIKSLGHIEDQITELQNKAEHHQRLLSEVITNQKSLTAQYREFYKELEDMGIEDDDNSTVNCG